MVARMASIVGTLVGVIGGAIALELSLEIGISQFLLGGGKSGELTRLLVWRLHLVRRTHPLSRRFRGHYRGELLRVLALTGAHV